MPFFLYANHHTKMLSQNSELYIFEFKLFWNVPITDLSEIRLESDRTEIKPWREN